MKKIFCMIIALILLLSMTGCNHYSTFIFNSDSFVITFHDYEKDVKKDFFRSKKNDTTDNKTEEPDIPEKRTITIGKNEYTLSLNFYSETGGYKSEKYKDSENGVYVNYYSGTDRIWEIRQTGTDRAPVLTQLITMTDENSVIDSAKDIFAQLRGMETRYDEFTIRTELRNENGRYANAVNEFIKAENGQEARYELTFNLKAMDEIYATMQLWFNEKGEITGYSAPDTSKVEKAWRGVTWDNEALEKQLISLMEQILKERAERDGHKEALAFCNEKHEYTTNYINYHPNLDKNGNKQMVVSFWFVTDMTSLEGWVLVRFGMI